MRFVQARWYTTHRIAPIRAIVVHDMEAPEGPLTAENVAHYFATTDTQASAHICVDNNSAVRCVADYNTAWAAPGCNADGLQLEIAGYTRQTRAQWLDDYSTAALDQAAKVAAAWAANYDIPVRRLTHPQLQAGQKGFTGHIDVSDVYKRSDHTDPGNDFPWDHFLAAVLTAMGTAAHPPVDTFPAPPTWPGRLLRYTTPPMNGTDVATWQRQLRARGWTIKVDGVFGSQSRDVTMAFQRDKNLQADGVVGASTWGAAWTAPVT
jgi:N-acetyl-anhydromuramyl-L-alanine amidase AmpD